MKNFKQFLFIILLLELFFAYTPVYAQTGTYNTPSYNYATQANVSSEITQYLCSPDSTAANTLFSCINQLYKFAIVIASVMSVFFIVIAGYVYMSAEGNNESVEKAKSILTSSIASIIILMAGYILLKALNPDLIQFQTIQPPNVTLNTSAPGVTAAGTTGATTAGGGTTGAAATLAGYNIGKYDAGEPAQAQAVISRYNKLSGMNLSTADQITQYMNSTALTATGGKSSSPLTGQMVLSAASQYNVDPKLIMAIMEIESDYGSAGMAVSTFNPGNVGNYTGVQSNNTGSWQAGVNAVANWLNNNRVSS